MKDIQEEIMKNKKTGGNLTEYKLKQKRKTF